MNYGINLHAHVISHHSSAEVWQLLSSNRSFTCHIPVDHLMIIATPVIPVCLLSHSICNRICFWLSDFYRARRMHSADYAVARCLSVRPSHAGIARKRLYISFLFHHRPTILFFTYQRDGNIPTGTVLTGASNAKGYEKITIFDQYRALSRNWCKIEPSHAVSGPTAKYYNTDRGKLVTLAFVLHGRRRRSVYDKKPQRYGKDNRAAFNRMQW